MSDETKERIQHLEYQNTGLKRRVEQAHEKIAHLENRLAEKDRTTVAGVKGSVDLLANNFPVGGVFRPRQSGSSFYSSLLDDLVKATDQVIMGAKLMGAKQGEENDKPNLNRLLTHDKNLSVEFLAVVESRRVKIAAVKKKVMRKILCITAIVKCNDYPNFNWAFYGEAIFNPNDKFDVFEGGKICIERMCSGERFAVKQFIWNGFIADRKRFEKMTTDYQSWMYREKCGVDAKSHIESEIKAKNEK